MTRNNVQILVCTLLLLLQAKADAQQFKYKSVLNGVPADGFYRIELSAGILGKCNTDCSDIRIIDAQKQQIPYIIQTNEVKAREDTSIDLKIQSAVLDTAGNSVIVIENLPETNLQMLELSIKSNAVVRNAKLSGSNDLQNWYIIDDELILEAVSAKWQGTLKYEIAIPPANYQYFKLTIINNKEDPLNILTAKTLLKQEDVRPILYKEQVFSIRKEKDSAGYSIYNLPLAEAIPAEKIQLTVDYPKYFQRNITILTSEDSGKTFSEVSSAIITSFGNTSINFGLIKSSYIRLIVENKDNPPLQISSINIGYIPRAVITYLEKGKKYNLHFGNGYISTPNYDLNAFKEIIPEDLQLLKYGNIERIEHASPTNQRKTTPVYWIWISLTGALLVLGYFTLRLLKDMKEKGI